MSSLKVIVTLSILSAGIASMHRHAWHTLFVSIHDTGDDTGLSTCHTDVLIMELYPWRALLLNIFNIRSVVQSRDMNPSAIKCLRCMPILRRIY